MGNLSCQITYCLLIYSSSFSVSSLFLVPRYFSFFASFFLTCWVILFKHLCYILPISKYLYFREFQVILVHTSSGIHIRAISLLTGDTYQGKEQGVHSDMGIQEEQINTICVYICAYLCMYLVGIWSKPNHCHLLQFDNSAFCINLLGLNWWLLILNTTKE